MSYVSLQHSKAIIIDNIFHIHITERYIYVFVEILFFVNVTLVVVPSKSKSNIKVLQIQIIYLFVINLAFSDIFKDYSLFLFDYIIQQNKQKCHYSQSWHNGGKPSCEWLNTWFVLICKCYWLTIQVGLLDRLIEFLF